MRSCAVAVLALCSVVVLGGQDTTLTEFEVASVKPARQNRPIGEVMRRPPPGQWQSFGATLHAVIWTAHPEFRQPGLIVGGPAWMRDERFDLQARMSPTASPAQIEKMIRRLLDSRFALRTHIESRTLDVFVLTQVQPGKLGPGMTRAAPACADWRINGGPIPEGCDVRRRLGATTGMTLSANTIADFITASTVAANMNLPNAIDRPIIDRTGLDGYFDMVGPSAMAAGRADTSSGMDGSFFTLLQEQLGLKLTRAREMVDVLMIDSVSMPEPD